MIPDIETVGATAGRAAADICKARTAEGGFIRRLLSEKVEAANLEAATLRDSESEDDRAVAIYWASFAEAFKSAFAGAK
jgi:hypothetical protein